MSSELDLENGRIETGFYIFLNIILNNKDNLHHKKKGAGDTPGARKVASKGMLDPETFPNGLRIYRLPQTVSLS